MIGYDWCTLMINQPKSLNPTKWYGTLKKSSRGAAGEKCGPRPSSFHRPPIFQRGWGRGFPPRKPKMTNQKQSKENRFQHDQQKSRCRKRVSWDPHFFRAAICICPRRHRHMAQKKKVAQWPLKKAVRTNAHRLSTGRLWCLKQKMKNLRIKKRNWRRGANWADQIVSYSFFHAICCWLNSR